jgi:hypothetical protein
MTAPSRLVVGRRPGCDDDAGESGGAATGRGEGSLTFLSSGDRTYELIGRWLSIYITQPHAELGRRGPVCPFVARALATSRVSVAAYCFVGEPTFAGMNLAIEQGAQCFQALARERDDSDLVSLIVAFPELEGEHWHLIDEGHRASKTKCVQNGLMLGQFHPLCDAPAAHNQRFPVNRAPIPLMVIRHMAPHDILFLGQDPVWLDHYEAMLARRGIAVDNLEYRKQYEQAVKADAT